MRVAAQSNAPPPPPAARQQAQALRDWWQLAGVDHATGTAPRAWLSTVPAAGAALPAAAAARPAASPAGAPAPADADWNSFATWQALVSHVRGQWPLCPILDGNPGSGLLVVGEAPSAEDLRTGRPFSGPAGRLLDRMLDAIDLDRSRAAIMLLACRRRVPGRPPPEAVARDLPLARRLIELLAPRHMLILGQIPTQALTGAAEPIGQCRGRWFRVGEADALVSWNPAYLLRAPAAKASAWRDLLALRRRMAA